MASVFRTTSTITKVKGIMMKYIIIFILLTLFLADRKVQDLQTNEVLAFIFVIWPTNSLIIPSGIKTEKFGNCQFRLYAY